ncbi:MAG: PQQ-dependent dehydrogenase, methanol/ethanol family [Novosphingobium sp.]|nr:PQQ-dependent dehydrogenase, methanol/ethanol family [Novosphingobium sp.]
MGSSAATQPEPTRHEQSVTGKEARKLIIHVAIAMVVLAALIVAATVALALAQRGPAPLDATPYRVGPLPDPSGRARLATWLTPATDGQWTMPLGDPAGTRFSGLGDINRDNVGSLKLVFTFDDGVRRGHEAPPLVVGDTMYVTTPYPDDVYALDLTKPGQPIKWHYQPKPQPAAQGVACCDVVNRGAVFNNGRLYFNTLDGQTIALDAASGHEVWRTKVAEINHGETITMAPLLAEGRVLVGTSGGEMGVRGSLTALDAGSGAIAWKAYSTGPDKEVLIGPEFKPFYDSEKGKDLGVTSWNPEGWRIGGGNPWGWISYDPELHMIYYGTGNPGPWNPEQRPGDNKWTAGVFARDVRTGQARWFYQTSPHDLFDYDDINEMILMDLPIGGTIRKVIAHPGRTGFFYIIDRQTGQVLSAEPYAYVNSALKVDLKSGRPVMAADKSPQSGRVVRHICPAAPGGKDWNPSAFSPRTGLVYIPHINLCMDEGHSEANYISGTPFMGAEARMYAGPGGNRGVLTAWDPAANHAVWEVREDLPVWSGALATAGDVVFYGTMDGWFKAVDAYTGKLLWRTRLDSGIIGLPMTYRGPDGRQYVAIFSGVGGWSGALVEALCLRPSPLACSCSLWPSPAARGRPATITTPGAIRTGSALTGAMPTTLPKGSGCSAG